MASILVIDDEQLVRETLEIVLEDAGHSVLLAENGRVGLKVLEKSPVDLVITDLFMPEMEGFETMMQIRRTKPELKVVVISGGGRGAGQGLFLSQAELMGASATLVKPFENSALLETIQRLLSETRDA